MVASGVPNTTVGNSLLNGLITKFILSELGIPISDSAVMVRGDDMISIVKGLTHEKAAKFKAIATSLGLRPKMKYGHDLPQVTFCSGCFWPAQLGDQLVRVFAPTLKAMCKIAWTHADVPARAWRQHARGVALGLQAITSHIPIFSTYIARILELCSRSDRFTQRALAASRKKYVPGSSASCTPETWSFLSARYGLDYATIQGCIDVIPQFADTGFLAHPWIARMIARVGAVEG
jgi:hypothetical protein